MRKSALLAMAMMLVFVGVGCGKGPAVKAEAATVSENGQAQDFKLTDMNGNEAHLAAYKGKVIVLNFFSTSCPPCRYELPDFEKLSVEYKDDVRIIAVNLDGYDAGRLKKFAQDLKLTFTMAMDDGKVSAAYGPIRYIPVTYVIDKNFNIARKYVGARAKDDFKADIEALK